MIRLFNFFKTPVSDTLRVMGFLMALDSQDLCGQVAVALDCSQVKQPCLLLLSVLVTSGVFSMLFNHKPALRARTLGLLL